MHDVHESIIATQVIGINLAKGIGEQSLVEVLNSSMYFFFLGRYATFGI